MFEIYSIDKDNVINSIYLTSRVTYEYALMNIVPLMQKLEFQRKIQSPKFYNRLANDIARGCIMPPLTLAFVEPNMDRLEKDRLSLQRYVNDNIRNGFILDGIQRLNTLQRSSKEDGFDDNLPIFFNILICPSNDKLLYRMITLNNGQKPMTARHQIEVLLSNIYKFDGENINVLTEKEALGGRARGAFKKSSFINAYLAFLSGTTTIDNKKIIENKLDELLATRIIEQGVGSSDVEYSDVISFISKCSTDEEVRKWFQNENNLIGFSVAMKKNFNNIREFSSEELLTKIQFIEDVLSMTEVSKVKVSSHRRKMVSQYFKDIVKIDQQGMEAAEAFMFLSDKVD
ncbi:hypothetical protein [Desulfovibrio piger]|uniref:hypothetical protein n=1 Tax=Desulfovibrio piger TaxID=901 RepID=UPI0026EBD99D|nr:hypothetical protein [Desulfovibrio piger]